MQLASIAELQQRYPKEHSTILQNLQRLGMDVEHAINTSLEDASFEVITYAQQGEIEHPLLKRLAVDIALYRICSTASMTTKEIRQRFEDAQQSLKRIAEGSIKLSDGKASGDETAASPQAKAQFFTQPRRFTRSTDV